MENITWRFPGNNYATDNGLNTADMETFKKDAVAALARELCQNTIDARQKDYKGPVKIDFKSFTLKREEIPGYDLIEKQIQACLETSRIKKDIKVLENMLSSIQKEEIVCLRISDFHTTGLIGVSTDDDATAWHYLVKGSGLSDKGDTSGGSKGIGKFATFVNSSFNTVFYSTSTITNENGYAGICKLCSAKIEGSLEKTQGIGYYSSDDMLHPIPGQLILDKSFARSECGSDIYIIGFKNDINWKRDVVSKILESFISAIIFDDLEVAVDDVVLNKETLKDIVYSNTLIKPDLKKSIVSQYLLLTDTENRYEDVITIEGYGTARLFLLDFSNKSEEYATNGVVMIRYPFMKIRDIPNISILPCSAMCIIDNNNLNKVLRDIENPQHTNWEFNRIEDYNEQKEVRGLFTDLKKQITSLIAEHLTSTNSMKSDLEGAADYLPGVDTEIDTKRADSNPKTVIQDKPKHQKSVRTKKTNQDASVETTDGDGIEPVISGDGDEDTLVPEGHNKGGGGKDHPGDNDGKGGTDGDGGVVFRHVSLRSMVYRLICLDRYRGKYLITFTSDYTEPVCTLQLNALDEGGNTYPISVLSASINNQPVVVKDNSILELSIEHGKKYNVLLETDQTELFSGEVKVYAYRK